MLTDDGKSVTKTNPLPTYQSWKKLYHAGSGTLVKEGAGVLHGFFCSSAASTPTVKVWDNTSAAGAMCIQTFTPSANTFYNFGDMEFDTGCYITFGGSVKGTILYR